MKVPSLFQRVFNNKAYRLQKTLERFAATDMGRDLLAFAAQNGITFDMQSNLPTTAMYAPEEKRVTLNADHPDDLHIVNLAHELRHVWQHKCMGGFPGKKFSPAGQIVFLRHIEADAWAYSHAFLEDFEKKTGDQGPREAYRFFTVTRGMSASKMHDVAYGEKVAGYVTELGRSFGDYDVTACNDAIKDLKAGNAVLLAPEVEKKSIVALLRSFDQPWGHAAAPFATLTDADFVSFDRVTLKEENKALLQRATAAYLAPRSASIPLLVLR